MMLFTISCFYAVSAVICYKIMNKLVRCASNKRIILCAFSIAAVFVPVKFVYVMNEHIYILLNWIILYLLVTLMEKNVNKIHYTGYLLIVLVYALTVHEKSLTLWFASSLTIIAVFVVFRDKLIKFPVFVIGGFLSYEITKKVIRKIRHIFFIQAENEITNTSASTLAVIFEKLKYFKSPVNWIFPVITCFSQIYFMSLFTGGVFLVAFIFSIYFIFTYTFTKKEKCEEVWERQIYIIALYSIVCIFLTVVIQAIAWMPDINSLTIDQIAVEIWGKRAKLYLRYFACYCGPIIMLFGVYFLRYLEKLKKIFRVSAFINIFFGIIVVAKISCWYETYQMNESPIYSMFMPFVLGKPSDYLTRKTFIIAIIVGLAIFVFIYMCIFKNMKKIVGVFLALLLVHEYLYTGVTVYKNSSSAIYKDNYPVYCLLDGIEDQTEHIIYMPEMKKEDIRLKFYLTDYTIVNRVPDLSSEHVVVIIRSDGVINEEYANYTQIESGAYEIYLSPDINIR